MTKEQNRKHKLNWNIKRGTEYNRRPRKKETAGSGATGT